MIDPWSRRRLDDFWPRDNLPWEACSELLLRCRTEAGFVGLRSFADIDRHVAWIARRLPAGARVLDLGCGPGLYANRLARHGLRLVGVDISAPLLRFAEAEAASLATPPRYQRASLLDPDLGLDRETPPFAAVLLVNSPLGQLDAEQVTAVVRAIAARLVPGGWLLCEAPAIVASRTEDGERVEELRSTLSPLHAGPHRWLRRHLSFVDRGERVTHHVVETPDGRLREHWSRSRLFTDESITAVLTAAGLVVRRIYGMSPGRPRDPDDEILFAWATRAEGA